MENSEDGEFRGRGKFRIPGKRNFGDADGDYGDGEETKFLR